MANQYKEEHYGGVTFKKITAQGKDAYIADRNLYLDKDDNLVEEDNPAQARQLVGKGGALSEADARKYGLIEADETAEAEAETEEADGGEKASSPSANKAKTPAKNKGAK